ncbi:MAG: phosphate signaling complex protein PhoU [Agathobacter sp.]|nr:phosphate signaling complex protein PhoU [Agathobacter sp.]
MRKRFDQQLEELNQEMQEMGRMVEDAIQKAIEALLKQDAKAAQAVMEADTFVDQKQKEIESICFTLLMQQQPVASDLRIISAALKMVTDMERIGDHAADISEMTLHLAREPYIKNLEHIRLMATETAWMLLQSIEAYVEKDIKKASGVIAHDDIVDELFADTKKELIELIHKDKNNGEQAADLLMVAKYFERIGDHAVNLSEWVIFSIDKRPRG